LIAPSIATLSLAAATAILQTVVNLVFPELKLLPLELIGPLLFLGLSTFWKRCGLVK
jgi:hypothetical protein